MEAIDPRIIRMLKRHHVFTLATASGNVPWCASCFYTYHPDTNRILFTSDKNTRHISEALAQNEVSGSIALETSVIGKIRGVQFLGVLSECTDEAYSQARRLYLKRFPYAAPFLGSTALWQIGLSYLKMTDNRLGFGKKLIWCKNS